MAEIVGTLVTLLLVLWFAKTFAFLFKGINGLLTKKEDTNENN